MLFESRAGRGFHRACAGNVLGSALLSPSTSNCCFLPTRSFRAFALGPIELSAVETMHGPDELSDERPEPPRRVSPQVLCLGGRLLPSSQAGSSGFRPG